MQAQRSPSMAGGGGAAAVAAAAAAGAAVGMPSQGAVPVRRRCEGTAMGAITLDLRPGLGVGPFTLGENPNHPPPAAPAGNGGRWLLPLLSSRFGREGKKDFKQEVS